MSTATDTINLYYDSEVTLAALLKLVDEDKLRSALVAMLGDDMRLVSMDGQVLYGPASATGLARAPVSAELEPVGYLESSRPEMLAPAAALVDLLLVSAARYYMASALQMESVQADFEELQRKNEALTNSEDRYRQLASDLEQRVAEQVKTIEQAQRQLYQAEKLASVGQLAAGVAHEINNPLGFIRSNLNTAGGYVERIGRIGRLMRSGQDAKVLAAAWKREQLDSVIEDFPVLLQESIHGTERVAKIVAALKDFSSIDRTGETATDINALLQNVCQVAAGEFGERIRARQEYGVLPEIRCHPGRLSQVFMNLLLNAVQAISGPGEVHISTASDGREITVCIRDTGRGIPENDLARIFDPFFSTRDVGQGTGLGLTVARDVVQTHGGRIAVESRPGIGTSFTVHLPLARES